MAGDLHRATLAYRHMVIGAQCVEDAILNDYSQRVIDVRMDELMEALTRYGRYAVV